MWNRLAVLTGSVLAVTLTAGCQNQPAPTAPEVPIPAASGGAGGGGDGGALLGEVGLGDFIGTATTIESTCPGGVTTAGWHVSYEHTQCLIVSPDWNAASGYAPYSLTDDLVLVMHKEKGKNGRITSMRLIGQDVIGGAGIAHQTDFVPVAIPVVPTKAGYALHVHANNMEVWRMDSHTGGNRVAMIGWISIGDIVVRPQ